MSKRTAWITILVCAIIVIAIRALMMLQG